MVRNAVTGNRLVWSSFALYVALAVAAVTVPVPATALQIEPIGAQGRALAITCSLPPPADGQSWLAAGSGSVRY